MGDLNIRFSALGGENNADHSKLSSQSLDLKINNGVLEKVVPEREPPKKDILEKKLNEDEYFQNLFEKAEEETPQIKEEIQTEPNVATSLADEIFEEITSEIEEFEDTLEEETPQIKEEIQIEPSISTSLADEIFEEITSEIEEFEDTLEEETPQIKEEIQIEPSISTSLADEIFEEITSEIEEFEDTLEEETPQIKEEIQTEPSVATSLADEIFEEITSETEEFEDTPTLDDENIILKSANEPQPSPNNISDQTLLSLSEETVKDKYDFLNLCVLSVLILFLGLTFIFMKQSTSDEGISLSLETLKTGEYTQYLGENFTSKMPLEKTMTQANILMKKLFGKTDLEFVKFESTEPPNGPITEDELGGISDGESLSPEKVTTTVSSVTGDTTTTPKLPQNFEMTTPEETDEGSSVFTGRPIKTTTTKVTTTLKLPETTDETTTGKVNLILP